MLRKFINLFRLFCKGHKLCENIAKRVMGTITHVATQDPVAALTFDDGPHPEFTPRLLDLLEKHQAKATFFMLGVAARKHPELVKQVAEARHAIGNHTDSHLSFQQISRRERRKQLLECEKAIAPYGSRLFRPPHGHQSIASRFDAIMLRFKVVTWNVASQDWSTQDVDWLVDQLGNQIQPGSIILLHDALHVAGDERYKNRYPMLEALDRFLEKSKDHYSFVTLPELFKRGRPVKENWYRGVATHGVYETEMNSMSME